MTESNTINYNKQDDDNVLRAEDIVPPFNPQKLREKLLRERASSLTANQQRATEDDRPESSDMSQKVNEIPKFDLAEQIMAAQRKITSVRRKAPGRKAKSNDLKLCTEPLGSGIKQPPEISEIDPIISEIVTRDIEKLYCGGINNKNF